MKKIILFSENVELDRRVQDSFRQFPSAKKVDIRLLAEENIKLNLWHFLYIVKSIHLLPGLIYRLCLLDDLKNKGLFLGLRACLKELFFIFKVSAVLKKEFSSEVELIYAHDLTCASAVFYSGLWKAINTRFIYDSHELQFNRNRKIGKLRLVIDAFLDCCASKVASEIRVVNKPLVSLLSELYLIPSDKFKIYNNNFFKDFDIGMPSSNYFSLNIGLVYVGGGYNGRGMSRLVEIANKGALDVMIYYLGDTTLNRELSFSYGPKDYENHLISYISKGRYLMWCTVDDTGLSYKLSLPNKFFQAMAIGLPVVVSPRTYLAELVERFEIGVVLDEGNLDLKNILRSEKYPRLVSNVKIFWNLVCLKNITI